MKQSAVTTTQSRDDKEGWKDVNDGCLHQWFSTGGSWTQKWVVDPLKVGYGQLVKNIVMDISFERHTSDTC